MVNTRAKFRAVEGNVGVLDFERNLTDSDELEHQLNPGPTDNPPTSRHTSWRTDVNADFLHPTPSLARHNRNVTTHSVYHS